MSTVGTIGNCAVVKENILPANSDRHVGIIRIKEKLKPYFLSTFLLSKYGKFQTFRESTGNVQLNLFIYKIKELLVPNLSNSFQQEIEKLCEESFEKRRNSYLTYYKAESFLLEEMNLQDFEPSKEAVNVKSFSESFGSTGRLDAEYYQPKYEQVMDKITSQPYDTLANIVNITKSIEPGSIHYDKEGLPFMRVADFSRSGLTEPQKLLNNQFVNDNKNKIKGLKPKKGTILFSKDGSVGTAYHLRQDFNGITSSAILHLNIKDKKQVIPEYLTLALNSKLVQLQAERDAGGSIILHWRISEIQDVIVPIIDFDNQKKIAEFVENSFKLKKQSEQLIAIAKTAIEIAIEKDEKKAENYIKNKIEEFKIKL